MAAILVKSSAGAPASASGAAAAAGVRAWVAVASSATVLLSGAAGGDRAALAPAPSPGLAVAGNLLGKLRRGGRAQRPKFDDAPPSFDGAPPRFGGTPPRFDSFGAGEGRVADVAQAAVGLPDRQGGLSRSEPALNRRRYERRGGGRGGSTLGGGQGGSLDSLETPVFPGYRSMHSLVAVGVNKETAELLKESYPAAYESMRKAMMEQPALLPAASAGGGSKRWQLLTGKGAKQQVEQQAWQAHFLQEEKERLEKEVAVLSRGNSAVGGEGAPRVGGADCASGAGGFPAAVLASDSGSVGDESAGSDFSKPVYYSSEGETRAWWPQMPPTAGPQSPDSLRKVHDGRGAGLEVDSDAAAEVAELRALVQKYAEKLYWRRVQVRAMRKLLVQRRQETEEVRRQNAELLEELTAAGASVKDKLSLLLAVDPRSRPLPSLPLHEVPEEGEEETFARIENWVRSAAAETARLPQGPPPTPPPRSSKRAPIAVAGGVENLPWNVSGLPSGSPAPRHRSRSDLAPQSSGGEVATRF